MTQTETRNIGYGFAASVALHLLFFAGMAWWMDISAYQRRFSPPPADEAASSVSLVFADDFQILPEEAPPEPEPAQEMEQKPKPEATKPPSERYIRTTQNEASTEAPEKADFVSDRNTVASSKMGPSADGRSDLPTMEGVSIATNELANRDYKDGEIMEDSTTSTPPKSEPVAAPVTPPAPEPMPVPAQAPTPPSVPKPETEPVLAMRTPEPPSQPQTEKKEESSLAEMMRELDQKLAARNSEAPTITTDAESAKPGPEPEQPMDTPPAMEPVAETPPAPRAIPIQTPPPMHDPAMDPVVNTLPKPRENAFQPQTRTSSVKGTISNRGTTDSVNAAATPTGRYMRQVTSSIERKWHALRKVHQDFVEPGKLRIRFYVNKDGKTEDITILDNKANAVLTDFSLTAILKAEIPPIPKDLLPILEKERVEIEYDIVIY